MHEVGDDGAAETDRIDAEMGIEAAVLDGDDRFRDIG
jgi:hypothetical protein